MKKKPDFLKIPTGICNYCEGRGEIKDKYICGGLFQIQNSYWTYKKCLFCMGSGKQILCCLECGELLEMNSIAFYCCNNNCKRVGLFTVASIDKKNKIRRLSLDNR